MYVCWTIATVAVAGYGLGRTTLQLMLACLVFNALETAGTIVWSTIKQRHVPSSLLGRVSSLDWLISVGLLPRLLRAHRPRPPGSSEFVRRSSARPSSGAR